MKNFVRISILLFARLTRLEFTPRSPCCSILQPRSSYIFRPLTSTCSLCVTGFTPTCSAFGRCRHCSVCRKCVCVRAYGTRLGADTHVCRCDRRERWSRWLRHGRFRLVVRSSLSVRALRSSLLQRLSRRYLTSVHSPCDTRAYVHASTPPCM